jgi:endonuclease G
MTEQRPLDTISCQGVGGPCRPVRAGPIVGAADACPEEAAMAGTALVLVHGRSQQMPSSARRGPAEEAAFVAKKRQAWLAGLAKGLTLAGLPPVDPSSVWFPYYGNRFADAVAARERRGLPRPDLEGQLEGAADARPPSADALILDSALLLGFTPEREALPTDDDTGELDAAWRAYIDDGLDAVDFGSVLRSRLLRAALQYLARKTGASQLVIERFLTDVAYYLDVPEIRDLVLDIVVADVRSAAAQHDRVVLLTHSLGTVVGYDLFDVLRGVVDVPLFITAGCPLGLPVVERSLLPGWTGSGKRPGPAVGGAAVPWLNAYDVRDFVALASPLAGFYAAPLQEERTFNASDPHSIQDYLADPDVARPIGHALAGKRPW